MTAEPYIAPWDAHGWHPCSTCDEYAHLFCSGCAAQERARCAAVLSDLRKEVVHDFLDPCFCDDLAEECVACSRIRGVLALIDKRLEAPRG